MPVLQGALDGIGLAYVPLDLARPYPTFQEPGALAGQLQRPLIPEEPPVKPPTLQTTPLSFWDEETMRRGFTPEGSLGAPAGSGIPPARGVSGIPAPEPNPLPPNSPPTVVKQWMLMPQPQRNFIVSALKETGMTLVDIANFLRANIFSLSDFTGWRQQLPQRTAGFTLRRRRPRSNL